jgi:NADPH:quinone reductase-like Zn-dependent oxidoreductase
MSTQFLTTLAADRAGRVSFDGLGRQQHDLAGHHVVVTGGASGIGEACCSTLAAAGAHVVIADRNETLGLELQRRLEKDGRGR